MSTTITDETTTETAVEPELLWLSVHDLDPNPDNPRQDLGDLTELVRSVKAHGVLQALGCLPADDQGRYMIVSGHRRHAAALRVPDREVVPVVVRAMTRVEALESMLVENLNRSDLSTGEEIAAIERLMSLDDVCTPARLCRRLGRSQGWVRSRMSLAVLPAAWRAAIDDGRLTLAAAEAVATAADLGPEHVEALCEHMASRHHQEVNGQPGQRGEPKVRQGLATVMRGWVGQAEAVQFHPLGRVRDLARLEQHVRTHGSGHGDPVSVLVDGHVADRGPGRPVDDLRHGPGKPLLLDLVPQIAEVAHEWISGESRSSGRVPLVESIDTARQLLQDEGGPADLGHDHADERELEDGRAAGLELVDGR